MKEHEKDNDQVVVATRKMAFSQGISIILSIYDVYMGHIWVSEC